MAVFTSKNNKFIITGGPGFGKTTLLQELGVLNFTIFQEAARDIMNEQRAKNGSLFPWTNRKDFDSEILERMIRDYHAHDLSQIAFFDRGIIDLIGWAIYDQLDESRFIPYALTIKYESLVFFTPEWEEIYISDYSRRFSFSEASIINKQLLTTYIDYGFTIKELPKSDVHTRSQFVINEVKKYLTKNS